MLKPPDRGRQTCFGMPYRAALRVIAVLNMVQAFGLLIVVVPQDIVQTIRVLRDAHIDEDSEQKIIFSIRIAAWVGVMVICLLNLVLDVALFRTSTAPDTRFLRIYVVIQCSVSLLLQIAYIALISFGYLYPKRHVFPYPSVLGSFFVPVHILFRISASYIMLRYSRDIEFQLEWKSGYRALTPEEIHTFEMGSGKTTTDNGPSYANISDIAEFTVYKDMKDRQRYEIKKTDLDFNDSTTLGHGEYGCVYKVNWRKMETVEAVAVKTVNPQITDIHKFKSLLTEAKVMMFMGKHENVVGLLGLCTEEIKERKLFIVCELCELGNLKMHLRSERNAFVNLFSGGMNHHDDKAGVEHMTTPSVRFKMRAYENANQDLIRWATEIASGMAFLETRKIVHGDLATRNILISSTRTAKITDFGLSRRLYNYSIYRKRHNTPLPWRWLALESLIDMNFSTYSDVWSYGITCWEIFELGARPWPDFPNFTLEFIKALKDGKIPEKGRLCSNEIYDKMSLCWSRDPLLRPIFTQLKDNFSKIMQHISTHHSQGTRR